MCSHHHNQHYRAEGGAKKDKREEQVASAACPWVESKSTCTLVHKSVKNLRKKVWTVFNRVVHLKLLHQRVEKCGDSEKKCG